MLAFKYRLFLSDAVVCEDMLALRLDACDDSLDEARREKRDFRDASDSQYGGYIACCWASLPCDRPGMALVEGSRVRGSPATMMAIESALVPLTFTSRQIANGDDFEN